MTYSNNNRIFIYPEELRDDFIKTEGLTFRDGTHIDTREIWRFMTDEAPKRFPSSFDMIGSNIGRVSDDAEFFSGIKRSYITLTLKDRLLRAHDKGVPIVLIQGGQSMDPYYAAGGIPLRPGFVLQWAREMEEGLSLRQAEARGLEILETGRRTISIEACNQIAAHAAIANKIVPVDLLAPYLCLRCSDMAFLVESHRSNVNHIPGYLVDFPVNQENKEWAVKYLESELRELTNKISRLSGKKISDETIFEEIRIQNKGRRLAREIIDMWWNAPAPPTNSTDFYGIPFLANDYVADPEASIQVLNQIKTEVGQRIKDGVKGKGLADKPKRVFVCGSCVGPNPHHIEKVGAVLVGRDDNWSSISVDVEEEGNPYENLSKAILSFPYELPTEKRAEWTVDQVKKSKADGVLFMYNWGCNYQTAIARMVMDIVKEKTGLPSTFIEVGELGRSEATEQSENRIEAFIEML